MTKTCFFLQNHQTAHSVQKLNFDQIAINIAVQKVSFRFCATHITQQKKKKKKQIVNLFACGFNKQGANILIVYCLVACDWLFFLLGPQG